MGINTEVWAEGTTEEIWDMMGGVGALPSERTKQIDICLKDAKQGTYEIIKELLEEVIQELR